MALEVLRHGIVVADKNISTDSLVPRQGLGRRQSLKPLIHRRLILAVAILTTLLIPPILLPQFTTMLRVVIPPINLPIHRNIIREALPLTVVTVEIHRRRGVNPLIEPAVEPGGARAVPGVVDAAIEAIVDRRLPRIVAEADVEIRLQIASEGGFPGVAEVEVAALLRRPLGDVVGAPDRVVEREIGQTPRLEAEVIAELPKRRLIVLH